MSWKQPDWLKTTSAYPAPPPPQTLSVTMKEQPFNKSGRRFLVKNRVRKLCDELFYTSDGKGSSAGLANAFLTQAKKCEKSERSQEWNERSATSESAAGSHRGGHRHVDKHKWFRSDAYKRRSTVKTPKEAMEKGKKKRNGEWPPNCTAPGASLRPQSANGAWTGPLKTCRCIMVAAYSKVQKEKTFAMNSGRKANSELHSTLGGRGLWGRGQWELIHTKHLLWAS